MADQLQLTVVTPERALLDETVDEVQVPGKNGYLGLLPGHAPLFSELATGILTYTVGSRVGVLAVSGGFVEVLNDEVRVLADVAETAAQIDRERAEAALARAEALIARGGEDVDYPRAQAALLRAQVRLEAARSR